MYFVDDDKIRYREWTRMNWKEETNQKIEEFSSLIIFRRRFHLKSL